LKVPSPHFNERELPINTILIHYTDMPTAKEALAWLSNPQSKVSSHYLIDEMGQVYQLVEEDKRAWHAGEGYWQGCTDLNSCSIGIELANPGHSHGYIPFPEAQIDALLRLCVDIRTRWDILDSRILGHSDIAPRRKQDPGHLFPWETLARAGLGLWPTHSNKSKFPGLLRSKAEWGERLGETPMEPRQSSLDITEDLAKIGYETVSPTSTLLAFQRHFQPHKVDGVPDYETLSVLYGLLKTF
ncbi:MAG TPA: N-acetylmuramoyl-L-alanine amidase, partial [Alphaproteobacteria bacterium]|nr:N-acetylmuramoyl-L-alanine amidase [Alphaproteobacteria bacterium]